MTTTDPLPHKPSRRPRKKLSVQFRVEESQIEALERAADLEGEALANWCRRNLLKLAGWRPGPPSSN